MTSYNYDDNITIPPPMLEVGCTQINAVLQGINTNVNTYSIQY